MKLFNGALALGILAGSHSALAQNRTAMPDAAANLVVKVITYADPTEVDQIGAGIVIAASNRLVIATAAHVVLSAAHGGHVRVVFHFAPTDSVDVQVDKTDPDLDLALLSLSADRVHAPRFEFDRLGDPWALRIGDPVIPVGCPDGVCWEPPISPDRLIGVHERGIAFESFFISPGSSGGALFNRYWEVLGLVVEKRDPQGRALSMQQVGERAKAWGYTAQLRAKTIPRAGYQTRVSLSALAPTSGSVYESGRFPSGRAALLLRGQERIGWHLSIVRLAPSNLAVTAGLAGVDLRLAAGPVALTPFVEAGFGRVEGRFDGGGYYVSGGGGPVYQPLWQKTSTDEIGYGAGASVEVAVFPHVSFEATGGHWGFRVPANLPSLPSVFLGAGVRLGF
ncbi:MAG TPA: serine protease [Gemmatimonadales bacterium]|nr:serine protease [Gemmatimonadales bacterium]